MSDLGCKHFGAGASSFYVSLCTCSWGLRTHDFSAAQPAPPQCPPQLGTLTPLETPFAETRKFFISMGYLEFWLVCSLKPRNDQEPENEGHRSVRNRCDIQFNVTQSSGGRQVRGCIPEEGRHASESNVYFAHVSRDNNFGRQKFEKKINTGN